MSAKKVPYESITLDIQTGEVEVQGSIARIALIGYIKILDRYLEGSEVSVTGLVKLDTQIRFITIGTVQGGMVSLKYSPQYTKIFIEAYSGKGLEICIAKLRQAIVEIIT